MKLPGWYTVWISLPRWRTVRRSVSALPPSGLTGANVHIVDFTAGVSPTGGFRYPAIPVQLVEPGVCIRLQYTTEPRKMGLRMDAFLSGL